MSLSLRAGYLHKLLGILLERFISSLLFTYLFNHLYKCGLVNIHFVVCILLNFLAQIVPT